MKRSEALKYRKTIEKGSQSLSDEMALETPTLFPKWKADVLCTVGIRMYHEGVLYKCLQEHTSQKGWEPNNAPSLWAKILIENPNVIHEWEQPSSTNPFMKGDKVTHNGKTWVSDYDDNVWEPGVFGWSEI